MPTSPKQPIQEKFYPQVPNTAPVAPKLLNAHLRFLTDQSTDNQTAWQAFMKRLQVASGSITVNASSTSTVTINWPSKYKDTNYAAFASVEGTSLNVQNVLRSQSSLVVSVQNTDGANPHTGTVMILGFHF